MLKTELADFDEEMTKRPFIVVLNKIDLMDKNDLKEILKTSKNDYIAFSGVTGAGKEGLLNKIEFELDKQKQN